VVGVLVADEFEVDAPVFFPGVELGFGGAVNEVNDDGPGHQIVGSRGGGKKGEADQAQGTHRWGIGHGKSLSKGFYERTCKRLGLRDNPRARRTLGSNKIKHLNRDLPPLPLRTNSSV